MTEPVDIAAWGLTGTLSPADSGLINETFVLDGPIPAIIQRLNTDIFVPEVHEDIEAVTAHLAAREVPTPRLIRTIEGTLWVDNDAGCWRALTVQGDETRHAVHGRRDAFQVGALVGRFHAALSDFEWTFRSVRPGAHDTPAHLAHLTETVDTHGDHRLYDEVAALADQIRAAWAGWSGPTDLPKRVIHGDLKISNVRFENGDPHCLIDLDTLAWGTLDVELGDALRSWSNRRGEDHAEADFDAEIVLAALQGWASTGACTDPEWASVLPGLERISLELSARFAADALTESYFGWSSTFGGRGEHNLLRARGQLDLHQKAVKARPEIEARLSR